MKKSKIYEAAAVSVIRDSVLPASMRLDIISELLEKRSLEKFREERDGAENDNTEN